MKSNTAVMVKDLRQMPAEAVDLAEIVAGAFGTGSENTAVTPPTTQRTNGVDRTDVVLDVEISVVETAQSVGALVAQMTEAGAEINESIGESGETAVADPTPAPANPVPPAVNTNQTPPMGLTPAPENPLNDDEDWDDHDDDDEHDDEARDEDEAEEHDDDDD